MAEGPRERHAFDRYFRLGPARSVEKLHTALAEEGQRASLRALYGWSSRYHWQVRLAEYERAAQAAEDAARVQALREMRERQTKEGLLLQQKGTEWLAAMPPAKVAAEAAIRALVEGAKLERLARGEVTERTEVHGSDTRTRFDELSDQQLDELIRGAEAASHRESPPPAA